jgi:molybdopterin-guanine dinucleotide biosynthesis protein
MESVELDDYLGRRTLILGEVNTGKTTLTRAVLEALCRRGLGNRMAVVDLAPEIPEALAGLKGLPGVGGKLPPPAGCGVLYLAARLEPPRLSSKTEAEALEKAGRNRRLSAALFNRLTAEPREILLVNDATLFLQEGTAEELIGYLDRASTVVVNGYRGRQLGRGILSERERGETEKLMAHFERQGRVLVLTRRE